MKKLFLLIFFLLSGSLHAKPLKSFLKIQEKKAAKMHMQITSCKNKLKIQSLVFSQELSSYDIAQKIQKKLKIKRIICRPSPFFKSPRQELRYGDPVQYHDFHFFKLHLCQSPIPDFQAALKKKYSAFESIFPGKPQVGKVAVVQLAPNRPSFLRPPSSWSKKASQKDFENAHHLLALFSKWQFFKEKCQSLKSLQKKIDKYKHFKRK